MSELKVYHCHLLHNEYTEFYSKSEADKVIAGKDKEIAKLGKYIDELQDKVTGLLLRDRNMALNFNNAFKALTHSDYKRCLAMADKCVNLCHKAKDLYRWAEDENLEHHYNRKIEFFARWHLRWLKIAEKFK